MTLDITSHQDKASGIDRLGSLTRGTLISWSTQEGNTETVSCSRLEQYHDCLLIEPWQNRDCEDEDLIEAGRLKYYDHDRRAYLIEKIIAGNLTANRSDSAWLVWGYEWGFHAKELRHYKSESLSITWA